jgi:hypothetical protein
VFLFICVLARVDFYIIYYKIIKKYKLQRSKEGTKVGWKHRKKEKLRRDLRIIRIVANAARDAVPGESPDCVAI